MEHHRYGWIITSLDKDKKKGAAQTALARWWDSSNSPDTLSGWLTASTFESAGTNTCVKGSTDGFLPHGSKLTFWNTIKSKTVSAKPMDNNTDFPRFFSTSLALTRHPRRERSNHPVAVQRYDNNIMPQKTKHKPLKITAQ